MLIERNVPAVFLLNTTCATTPTPKTIRMKVPKNSASISRNTPRGIGILLGESQRHGTQTRAHRARHESARGGHCIVSAMPFILALDQGTTSSRAIVL